MSCLSIFTEWIYPREFLDDSSTIININTLLPALQDFKTERLVTPVALREYENVSILNTKSPTIPAPFPFIAFPLIFRQIVTCYVGDLLKPVTVASQVPPILARS